MSRRERDPAGASPVVQDAVGQDAVGRDAVGRGGVHHGIAWSAGWYGLALVAATLQVASIQVGSPPPPGTAARTVAGVAAVVQGVLLLLQRRLPGTAGPTAISSAYALQCAATGLVLPAAPLVSIGRLLLSGAPPRAAAPPVALLAVGVGVGAATSPESAGGLLVATGLAAIVVLATALIAARRGRGQALAAQDRAAALQAEAEHRLAIARELHDSVGHGLSVIAVQSGTARVALDAGQIEAARRAMEAVEAGSRQALREMRQLVVELRRDDATVATPPGLGDLAAVVDHVRSAGVTARLDVDPGLGTVPAGIQLAAYRVVQEALTNVVRHAPGSRATARIRVDGADLKVDVVDSGPTAQPGGPPASSPGRGTPRTPDRLGAGSGAGLLGLRERVVATGGTFRAGPDPTGTGWVVTVRLPLEPDGGVTP